MAVSADVPWLPEQYQQAGYTTAAFVSSLFVSEKYGFGRGFDHFEDFGVNTEEKNLAGTVDAQRVLAAARAWAEAQPPEAPFFVFIHLYDVHYAYDAPLPYDRRFDRPARADDAKYKKYSYYLKNPLSEDQMEHQIAQYDEEIVYVDASLRQFHDEWSRPAVWSLVADHGEEFGERGAWGHAHTLWPEQLHVPFLIWGAGVAAATVTERRGLEQVGSELARYSGVTVDSQPGDVPAQLAATSRFETLRMRWHVPPVDVHFDLRSGERSLCDLERDPRCAHPSTDDARIAEAEAIVLGGLAPDWTAEVGGIVVSDGVIVKDGVVHPSSLRLQAGDRFAVLPLDANVRLTVRGETHGPWRRLGGGPPEPDGALSWSAASGTEVHLTPAEREALEALGYIEP